MTGWNPFDSYGRTASRATLDAAAPDRSDQVNGMIRSALAGTSRPPASPPPDASPAERAALAAGLPAGLAGRLVGDDPLALAHDARALALDAGITPPSRADPDQGRSAGGTGWPGRRDMNALIRDAVHERRDYPSDQPTHLQIGARPRGRRAS